MIKAEEGGGGEVSFNPIYRLLMTGYDSDEDKEEELKTVEKTRVKHKTM